MLYSFFKAYRHDRFSLSPSRVCGRLTSCPGSSSRIWNLLLTVRPEAVTITSGTCEEGTTQKFQNINNKLDVSSDIMKPQKTITLLSRSAAIEKSVTISYFQSHPGSAMIFKTLYEEKNSVTYKCYGLKTVLDCGY